MSQLRALRYSGTGGVNAVGGRWTVEGLTQIALRLNEDRSKLASVATAIGDTFKGFGKREPTT